MKPDGTWAGLVAVIIMIATGCSSSGGATTPSAGIATVPLPTVAGTLPPPTPSTVATTAEIAPTTEVMTTDEVPTTDEATATTDVITRPYIDPAVCGSGAMSEFHGQDLTLFPFALGREQPIPVQVLGAPLDGVAKPFAVVLRLSAGSRDISEDHRVVVNGTDIGITVFANGNAAAAWTLPDGTKAYLRARDLDEAALTALVTRLTPRDADAPIPGFDLKPSSDPDAAELLSEHLNTGLTGTVTRFECDPGSNQGRYRVAVIGGDPVFVYLGIIDRPRPYAVGVNGDGAVTITNSFNESITLQQITNAAPAT